MSILDDIKGAINNAFLDDANSAFRPAILVSPRIGNPLTGAGGTAGDETPVRAFGSRYSDHIRGIQNLPDKAIKINMLQTNDFGDRVMPQRGDVVIMTETFAGSWLVEQVNADPAEATWTLQAVPKGD